MVCLGLFFLLDTTEDIVDRLVVFFQDVGPDYLFHRSLRHFVETTVEVGDAGGVAVFKRAFHRKFLEELRV